jgi:4-diphosphocytidyl-2-C-methyl-D-erythritol kinase
MTVLRETAFAKLNLALHVRRRREDGYHDLETLFAFANHGDTIEAAMAEDISLRISGPFRSGLSTTDNLVIRAAKHLRAHFGVNQGAAIHLDKQLPIASGIGGGSADAAATARLLNRLWNIGASDEELEQLLGPMGADIPACVQSRTVYGEGTGVNLITVADETIKNRPLLLVNPLKPLSTAPVFKAWDGIDRGELKVTEPWKAALAGRNDLQLPAVSLCPEIGDVLNQLSHYDADLVRMSGSGATCFAIFASAEACNTAKADINKACPEYWTMASSLR